MEDGRCLSPLAGTRKEKRPRKRRKTKTKTKTEGDVVKAQEQAAHMHEEESRWASEVQAAKKEAQTLQEALVGDGAGKGGPHEVLDARTAQQEEDSRRAAVNRKKKEGIYALDWAGRELGVGVRSHVEDFRFLVVKETYAAFVFDGTGWWDHAYWHDEGWYWGMNPIRMYKCRDKQLDK